MLLKIVVLSLSLLFDLCSMIGSAAVFLVSGVVSRHTYITHFFRHFFLITNIFSTVNSALATKLIIFFIDIQHLTKLYNDEINQSTWFAKLYHVSYALYYGLMIIQICLVSNLLYARQSYKRSNRPLEMRDYLAALAILIFGIAMAITVLMAPMKIQVFRNEINDPFIGVVLSESYWDVVQPYNLFATCGVVCGFLIWIGFLFWNKDIHGNELKWVSFGMATVVINLVALHFASDPDYKYLVEPATLVLPLTSSFFPFCVITSPFVIYPQARSKLASWPICKQFLKLLPSSRSTIAVHTVSNNTLIPYPQQEMLALRN